MKEKEPKTQSEALKALALAKWSLGLASASVLSIVFAYYYILPPLMLAGLFATPSAIIVGLISILKLRRSKRRLRAMSFAMTGVVIGLTMSVAIVHFGFRAAALFKRVVCGMNLTGLRAAVAVYAQDHDGKYPTPDKWCDLLLQGDYVGERQLVCRLIMTKDDKGYSYYAMNPDCQPNCPNDIVLLFETTRGWNQFGGPEILTTENHKGKGCIVLFNDGSVKFVEPQDLEKLKWKIEEAKD